MKIYVPITTEMCIWTMILEYGFVYKAIIIYLIACILCCLSLTLCMYLIIMWLCFSCTLTSHDELTPLHVYFIVHTISCFSSLLAHVHRIRLFTDKKYLLSTWSDTCLIIYLPVWTTQLIILHLSVYRIFRFTCIVFLIIPERHFELINFTPESWILENNSKMQYSYGYLVDLCHSSFLSVGQRRVVTEPKCNHCLATVFFSTTIKYFFY